MQNRKIVISHIKLIPVCFCPLSLWKHPANVHLEYISASTNDRLFFILLDLYKEIQGYKGSITQGESTRYSLGIKGHANHLMLHLSPQVPVRFVSPCLGTCEYILLLNKTQY